jgi:XapX domain-containing protein
MNAERRLLANVPLAFDSLNYSLNSMSYLISLAVGILVGLLYHVLGVRSPAPPLVALLGLLGMVIGEHTDTAIGQLTSIFQR